MRTRLTSSENTLALPRIRRINLCIPVAHLTTKRPGSASRILCVDERVLVPRSPIGELINNRFAGLIRPTAEIYSGYVPVAAASPSPVLMLSRTQRLMRSIFSPDALVAEHVTLKNTVLSHHVTPIRSGSVPGDSPPKVFSTIPIVTNPPYVDAGGYVRFV